MGEIDLNHITIQGWMVTRLGLKANELLVFALIYGFSQDGESTLRGGRRYISQWINSSLPTVDKALDKLIEKELIEKVTETINGVNFARYKVSLGVVKNFGGGSKETLPGSKESLPSNNISNNNSNIIKENIHKRKVFVKPSVEEVRAYCIERGNNINAESFIDYYESKGWIVGKTPMKDWKSAIRNWERNNYGRGQNNQSGVGQTRFSEIDYGESDI